MEIATSDKVGSGQKRPHIRKGYYSAKLKIVKPFQNKDEVLIEKKYGHQLIFDFEIYKTDQDTGAPIEQMKFENNEVILSMFVYYENKDDKGEWFSTVTANSKIAKLWKALGFEFDATKPIEVDNAIGKWIELNIDDYEKTPETGEAFTMSVIKDFKPYKGPVPNEDVDAIKASSSTSFKVAELQKMLYGKKITKEKYDKTIKLMGM